MPRREAVLTAGPEPKPVCCETIGAQLERLAPSLKELQGRDRREADRQHRLDRVLDRPLGQELSVDGATSAKELETRGVAAFAEPLDQRQAGQQMSARSTSGKNDVLRVTQ